MTTDRQKAQVQAAIATAVERLEARLVRIDTICADLSEEIADILDDPELILYDP